MQVHTFRAESLQAALQQVRRQLGPDAAILQTREKRPSRLGIFARPIIEVEATLAQANSVKGEGDSPSVQLLPPRTNSAPPQSASGQQSPDQRMPDQRIPDQRIPDQRIPDQRIPDQRIPDQRIPDQQIDEPQIANSQISSCLKVSGPIELLTGKPMVVALVGPTGCGKTTSLAKLAGNFRFELGCRVGLMALDNIRLGAVDQLLQYADMLSAPLEVVSSAEQVPAALQRLRKCDLVLIDTAGRAPRDKAHMAELHKFLELAHPNSIQLVVSASSSTAHVSQTVECFSKLTPTALLITKLDEAVDFGSWAKLLERSQLPVSYLTHGQRVPQDITQATTQGLTRLLLEQQPVFQPQTFQRFALQPELTALPLSN